MVADDNKWEKLKGFMDKYYRKRSTSYDEKYALETIAEFMAKLELAEEAANEDNKDNRPDSSGC